MPGPYTRFKHGHLGLELAPVCCDRRLGRTRLRSTMSAPNLSTTGLGACKRVFCQVVGRQKRRSLSRRPWRPATMETGPGLPADTANAVAFGFVLMKPPILPPRAIERGRWRGAPLNVPSRRSRSKRLPLGPVATKLALIDCCQRSKRGPSAEIRRRRPKARNRLTSFGAAALGKTDPDSRQRIQLFIRINPGSCSR